MKMEKRVLGKTGLRVGAVGLGTEYLSGKPRAEVVATIRGAIDRGINYFDIFYAQPKFRDTMGIAFKGFRD
jgi:aryl-alcohol dehydrogenase-like predicted oxidoreductase